jgi:hypothetical protein
MTPAEVTASKSKAAKKVEKATTKGKKSEPKDIWPGAAEDGFFYCENCHIKGDPDSEDFAENWETCGNCTNNRWFCTREECIASVKALEAVCHPGDSKCQQPRYSYVRGWLGMNKGAWQLAYERGLYKVGMHGALTQSDYDKAELAGHAPGDAKWPNRELDTYEVLGQCEDFANETTALAQILLDEGHILFPGVKYHAEMAGEGIEYAWGQVKLDARRANVVPGPHGNAGGQTTESKVRGLIPTSLPLERMWKFARKARDYKRTYLDHKEGIVDNEVNFYLLEKARATYKTHRNMDEIDRVFIANV